MEKLKKAQGSLAHFRELFKNLPPARPQEADYAAQMAGPAWLRGVAPPGLALLGLPGWTGKRFLAGGEGINLLKGRKGIRPALAFRWSQQPSALDGKPVLQIRYLPNARWPWYGVVDELRDWKEDTWLGMTYLEGSSALRMPLPFLLHQPKALHEPHSPNRV